MKGRWHWHYDVHDHYGEELAYFFIGFRPIFDREHVRNLLAEFLAQHKITRYGLYEVYGPVDLVLRAWLPRPVAKNANFHNSLMHFLSTSRAQVDQFEHFTVSANPFHWCWPEASAAKSKGKSIDTTVLEKMGAEELNDIAMSRDAQRAAPLLAANILRIRDDQPKGIRYFMMVPPSQDRINVDQENGLRADILKIVRSADEVGELVLYQGNGQRVSILIEGVVDFPNYLRIAEMNAALMQANLSRLHIKTTTFLGTSDDEGVEEDDGQFFHETANRHVSLKDMDYYLQTEENDHLERKGSYELNLEAYFARGTREKEPKLTEKVLSVIVSFLNGRGGDVLIGVLEDIRMPPNTRTKIEELPLIAGARICGIEIESGERGFDSLSRKIEQSCSKRVGAKVMPYISLHKLRYEGRDLCLVHVQPLPRGEWAYLDGIFYARFGSSTRELRGQEQDDYQRTRLAVPL